MLQFPTHYLPPLGTKALLIGNRLQKDITALRCVPQPPPILPVDHSHPQVIDSLSPIPAEIFFFSFQHFPCVSQKLTAFFSN